MFLLFITIATAITTADECVYEVNNQKFNLTSLSRSDFHTVRDSQSTSFFRLAYQFNICNNHPKYCGNTQGGAYEMLDVLGQLTDSCELIGKPETQQVAQIENGLQLTYSSGSLCHERNRSMNIQLLCSPISDDGFTLIDNHNPCNLTQDMIQFLFKRFSINSAAACPLPNSLFSHPHSILIPLVLFIIMMILASIHYVNGINKKKNDEYVKLPSQAQQQPQQSSSQLLDQEAQKEQ